MRQNSVTAYLRSVLPNRLQYFDLLIRKWFQNLPNYNCLSYLSVYDSCIFWTTRTLRKFLLTKTPKHTECDSLKTEQLSLFMPIKKLSSAQELLVPHNYWCYRELALKMSWTNLTWDILIVIAIETRAHLTTHVQFTKVCSKYMSDIVEFNDMQLYTHFHFKISVIKDLPGVGSNLDDHVYAANVIETNIELPEPQVCKVLPFVIEWRLKVELRLS